MHYNRYSEGYMKGRKRGIIRTDSRTYRSWASMITRCNYPSYPNYHLWGGRGIKVCKRWLGDKGFANFVEDMGERPLNTTLDRYPDKNGDYTPDNCRWASKKTQANNMSSNRWVVYEAEMYTIAQLAEELGIPYKTLYWRIVVAKWEKKDWGDTQNHNFNDEKKLKQDFNDSMMEEE